MVKVLVPLKVIHPRYYKYLREAVLLFGQIKMGWFLAD
jgi:hypothetical protein